jgi:hypothetical protein
MNETTNPGVAVDPQQVIAALRHKHAEQHDALTYQNVLLDTALANAQAEINELRNKVQVLTERQELASA